MMQAKRPSMPVTIPGPKSFDYIYDGNDLRVRKHSDSGMDTNYLHDGLSIIMETDGSGIVKRTYNPGISVIDEIGKKIYFMVDGLGSVSNLVDGKGNIVQSYTYEAFGSAVGVKKDTNGFRYIGNGFVSSDDDAQLQYMVHRWYDPKLGRFLSRDPKYGFLRYPLTLNRYIYVKNNPLKFIDILGLGGIPNSPYFPGGYSDPLLGAMNDALSDSEETIRDKDADREELCRNVEEVLEHGGDEGGAKGWGDIIQAAVAWLLKNW